MSLVIPNKAVTAVLVGDAQSIPRGTDIAICTPAGATVYTLPKLDVEPTAGSYMQGQVLQLRNRTGFTITLTPAAGDTIGGNATLAVTSQQYIILVYTGGSNWSIVARVTSGADPDPEPEAMVASDTATQSQTATPTGDTATQSQSQTQTQTTAQLSAQEARAKLPTTPVKTLVPKRP